VAARLCVAGATAALLLTLGAGWMLRGGNGRDPEEAAIIATLRAFEQAVAKQDVETVQSLTTEQFYREYLQLSGSASIFAESDPAVALGHPVERQVERVKVEGEKATVAATVRGSRARNVDAVEVRLQRKETGGGWLLSGLGHRKTNPDSGTQVIELTMRDHAFAPDPLFMAPGSTVVLRTRNIGSQPHMVAIWGVQPGADLIKVIEATGDEPVGIERIVQGSTFAPGDEGDITIRGGLKPGRYMLTCFLSDITSPELIPHYDIGMLTEHPLRDRQAILAPC
jgi:ketosteroid isomerase-like protein